MKVTHLNENLFKKITQKAKEIWNGVDIDNLTTEEIASKAAELKAKLTKEIDTNKMFNSILPYDKENDRMGKKLSAEDVSDIKAVANKAVEQLYKDVMGGQLELLNYKPSYLAAKIFLASGEKAGHGKIAFQETPFDRFLYNFGAKIL